MNIRLIVEYFLNHRQTLAVGIITTKTLMPPKLTNLSPAHSFRNLKVCLEPGILVSLFQLDLTNLTNFSIEFFVASQAHTLSIPSANYEKCFGQIKIQESFRTKRTLTDAFVCISWCIAWYNSNTGNPSPPKKIIPKKLLHCFYYLKLWSSFIFNFFILSLF